MQNRLEAFRRYTKDPFDRMLIAQTQAEGFELMTVDEYIPQYGIRVVNASS